MCFRLSRVTISANFKQDHGVILGEGTLPNLLVFNTSTALLTTVTGDGTVPIMSSGYMCSKGFFFFHQF